jgi:uncharacterized protein YydD (DUF2326 family)
MFLKSLKIEKNETIIREIPFYTGINLIVDETRTLDRRESGNNVGKTTVLRLIDYCLGSNGKNIYVDTEFKNKSNTQVEKILKNKNIIISLTLKDDLDNPSSREVIIRRNFLSRSNKIQEINGESYNNKEFPRKLKEMLFASSQEKPTFRQIISRNIRDEKGKLLNTIKVLHPTTTQEEYEALYLFWLGVDIEVSDRKQKLAAEKKIEESLQKRLRVESNLSQISQSLIVVNRNINDLTAKKDSFNLNENYEEELSALNRIKSDINKISTELVSLEFRKELIIESKNELENEFSEIDVQQVRKLYEEANALIPGIQKSFEDTLNFHNQMIDEKIKYITQELPDLEVKITTINRKLHELLTREQSLTEKLKKTGIVDELQQIISELNKAHERKGNLEEQKRLWENSNNKLQAIEQELQKINEGIDSRDSLIQQRIADFNRYFSEISFRLYGERFVLSSDKNDRGYELNISSISGNLGTGKKKGQIAAFDLAYIKFASTQNIHCLNFVLHDQIENVHDNQITNLLTEIVSNIHCQYVLPVLRDKLPEEIEIEKYRILSLSQSEKLFKLK